jgi:hypothetical protein
MPTITQRLSVSIGGVSISGTTERTADGQVSAGSISLPAAASGTLSARTSDTAGTLTLGSGHGIVTGNTIDIFWTDANGYVHCAHGCTVGTVSGTSVPFTGASFDSAAPTSAAVSALPAQDTAVTADVQTEVDFVFDGDDCELCVIQSTRKGHFELEDAPGSGSATITSAVLAANEEWSYKSRQNLSNPLTGNMIYKLKVSNGDSSNAATVKAAALFDSTP